MQKQNDGNNSFHGPKWLPPLAFVTLGLVGYVGFVWLRGNYLDALAIPLIFGFVWLAGMKQKLALAVALVAVYIMMAVPAMAAGLMDWSILNPILVTVAITFLSIGMYRFPWRKTIAMFIFFFLSLLLLYAFDILESNTLLVLTVGGGAGLLSVYLFPQLRQPVS